MLCPQPSWYEQNAHWWWTSTCEAIREAIKQVNPSRIVALSISNQRETFVPVDRNGDQVRNAILWMDQRARHLLPDLEKRLIGERFHRITGKILAGNLTISKLVWLRQNEPDIFQKATHFLDVQAYLIYCLTGLFITSWGSADPTGLFDLRNNQWSAELVAEAGLKTGQLPETAPPGT